MSTKYIFPLLLIVLDVGAAVVIAAAVLNICVTF